jgi:hypothetical protein
MKTYTVLQLITETILLMVFLGCAISNCYVLNRFMRHAKHGSMIPFLGGMAGVAAVFVLGWPWWLGLASLLLDSGSIIWLILTLKRLSK